MIRSAPRIQAAILAACILVLAIQRLHTYEEPLERDITTYALIGHEALGGRKLYSDLWDNKSPLVYATYAAGEIAAGYGSLSIFLLGLGAAVITLLGIHRAAGMSAGCTAGLWAGAAWTIVSADQGLLANQPNIEVFLNASMVWLLVLFMSRKTRPVAIGLLSAVASLYKLVILPVLILEYVARIALAPTSSRRKIVQHLLVSALICAGAWAAIVGYFSLVGRGEAFRDAVFSFNESFAGNLLDNIVIGLTPTGIMPRELWCTAPLVLLACIGVGWLVRSRQPQFALPLVAYAIGTVIAVALPGKFYAHYYQLWLPLYCVGAGIGIHAIGRLATPRWAHAVGATMLLVLLAFELPSYGQSAETWSAVKYGPVFVDMKRMAPEIADLLAPDETFFEWGDESGFYYYTHRHPPSGILYLFPAIVRSPMRPALEARLLADLQRSPPELLVVNTDYLYAGAEKLPILQWLGTHYVQWPQGPKHGSFGFFLRRDGALEARLRREGRA